MERNTFREEKGSVFVKILRTMGFKGVFPRPLPTSKRSNT